MGKRTTPEMQILLQFPFSMRPRLASELREAVGEGFDAAFDALIRRGELIAVFPEAKPGDSGRQFWAVRGHLPKPPEA